MKMKSFVLASGLALSLVAACGSKQAPSVANAGSGEGSAAAPVDKRSEIEKRRDAACENLGPRITTCAVVDAKKALADGTIKQKQYDDITRSEVLKKNTEEFIDKCEKPQTPYSSRQIRVLEVCPNEETECEPLMACLDNLNKIVRPSPD